MGNKGHAFMNIDKIAQDIIANIPYKAPEIINEDALLVMLAEALSNAYEQGKQDSAVHDKTCPQCGAEIVRWQMSTVVYACGNSQIARRIAS